MRRSALLTSLAVTATAALGTPLVTPTVVGASPVPQPGCVTVTATATATATTTGTGTDTARSPVPDVVPLTVADDGQNICVHPGQRVTVTLSVDPDRYPTPSTWWGPIAVDGSALEALPIPTTPDHGTTLAHFRAAHVGTATLGSTQSPCAAAPAASHPESNADPHRCLVFRIWSVTVTVR